MNAVKILILVLKRFSSLFRAETRTPGLSRKSNSTLSLVNDVEMEVTDQLITMPSNLSLSNDVEMEVGERIMKT